MKIMVVVGNFLKGDKTFASHAWADTIFYLAVCSFFIYVLTETDRDLFSAKTTNVKCILLEMVRHQVSF